MPDWLKLVRRRLAAVPLDSASREDVCAELAAHLEESYEAFRAEGLSESRATQKTLRQTGDWRNLQHGIVTAKNGGPPMKARLHQIWIPGTSMFALSTAILLLLQGSPFQDSVAWLSSGAHPVTSFGVSLPWLLSLPCLGASAAWLSSRAGGSRGTMLFASIFSVLALALAFVLMLPIGLALAWITGRPNDFGMVAVTLLSNWFGWILVPGATLLAGGLLVLLLPPYRTTGHTNVAR